MENFLNNIHILTVLLHMVPALYISYFFLVILIKCTYNQISQIVFQIFKFSIRNHGLDCF